MRVRTIRWKRYVTLTEYFDASQALRKDGAYFLIGINTATDTEVWYIKWERLV